MWNEENKIQIEEDIANSEEKYKRDELLWNSLNTNEERAHMSWWRLHECKQQRDRLDSPSGYWSEKTGYLDETLVNYLKSWNIDAFDYSLKWEKRVNTWRERFNASHT